MAAPVTFLAQRLGPHVGGVLTVHPVMSPGLAVFSPRRAEPAQALVRTGDQRGQA